MPDHVATVNDSKCDGVHNKIPQNKRKLLYSSKKRIVYESMRVEGSFVKLLKCRVKLAHFVLLNFP